ncbi:asparaginase [Reinekea sp. G2M2-21]|uniref:asparaginase n=1 Tax=Reinekea sp. G2M2-21 TaxID=2788942 RepID=UPI0018AC2607|nr:asparaginase [Reinekea sp. G2M2-21]
MANYLIINTGGTIGMVEGPHGLTPNAGEVENALQQHTELTDWHQHQLNWEHWSPLLDSSDLNPSHWYRITHTIAQAENIDGVLVIHGTDTLAYTASALSFLLADLTIPVVITGSMLPISATGTDALDNLQRALIALESNRPEVMVAVGEEVLPGSRVTKYSTQAMASFSCPGWDASHWANSKKVSTRRFTQPWRNPEVTLLTLYPGIPETQLDRISDNPATRAILISSYGNGNAANTAALRRMLASAQHRAIPVFVTSQCFEGNVDFGLYAASSVFTEHGAISCGMMPLEAAITKIQILCSEFDHADDIIQVFREPLAREWENQPDAH